MTKKTLKEVCNIIAPLSLFLEGYMRVHEDLKIMTFMTHGSGSNANRGVEIRPLRLRDFAT